MVDDNAARAATLRVVGPSLLVCRIRRIVKGETLSPFKVLGDS